MDKIKARQSEIVNDMGFISEANRCGHGELQHKSLMEQQRMLNKMTSAYVAIKFKSMKEAENVWTKDERGD